MKSVRFYIVFFISILLNFSIIAKENDAINMYPNPKEGYEQKVIQLDTLSNEDQYMVEIFVGKLMTVDACNRHNLMGTWKQEDVQGWGYSYYEFISNAEVMSTMIGCLDTTLQEKLIRGMGNMIRYNSKIPIVLYIPQGMTLQYRIWTTDNEWKQS